MRSFCTYFDSNYLDRGLCLWDSLRRYQHDAHLFVCCLDDKSIDVLKALAIPGITAIPLSQVEAAFPELEAAKASRSRVEYYFTITPTWVRFVLDGFADINNLTYVDSDLLFFSTPQPLFDEFDRKNGHVAIIAHRFTPSLQHLAIYGTYNVGWLTFRKSAEAYGCLLDWQAKCNEWCFDHVEGDRFADQKYLDAWPHQHPGIVVLDHPGANVALWNLERNSVRRHKRQLTVHGRPLIFYHFHGLSQINSRTFFTNTRIYDVSLNFIVRHSVYGAYMTLLRSRQRRLRQSEIRPLLRYKHTDVDVKFAKRHPFFGLFLFSIFGTALP